MRTLEDPFAQTNTQRREKTYKNLRLQAVVEFFLKNNNSLFNLSSFTVSEDNYRLTLGYHGIASSSLFNYISCILLNHLFLTMSKYFPKFCMCVLFVIFIIFL
jgi:hypothetical protein